MTGTYLVSEAELLGRKTSGRLADGGSGQRALHLEGIVCEERTKLQTDEKRRGITVDFRKGRERAKGKC